MVEVQLRSVAPEPPAAPETRAAFVAAKWIIPLVVTTDGLGDLQRGRRGLDGHRAPGRRQAQVGAVGFGAKAVADSRVRASARAETIGMAVQHRGGGIDNTMADKNLGAAAGAKGASESEQFLKEDGSAPTIVVAGGGTAGHIEPALAVADAILNLQPEARVIALGTNRGLESTLVPARGYDLELIPPVPVPRKPTADLFKLPLNVARAVRETRKVFKRIDADAVIGFGGYVSAPAYMACRAGKKIPFLVHEANARAGLANKLGVALGGVGLAAVTGSGLKAEVVGNPVRASLAALDRDAKRAEAREFFGLPQEGPVLFVTGGSQGARSINEAVSGAAAELAQAGVSVLHAYGKKNHVEVESIREDAPYVAVPYIDRMDLAYSAADLILCRSGAMTVAEVSAVGLPAVYVPLPHGNGEQALNATDVIDAGGGILIADESLTAASVSDIVIPLVTSPEKLADGRRALANIGHGNAAENIARRVLSAAVNSKK